MSGFQASPTQRLKCRDSPCAYCNAPPPSDPSHVVSRAQGGCNEALCVVPLCRRCHNLYDTRKLDLLPALEPKYRDELAHALGHLGLVGLYRRVTNTREAA